MTLLITVRSVPMSGHCPMPFRTKEIKHSSLLRSTQLRLTP